MSADLNIPSSHHVRSKKYIDTNIQGSLIVGLLLLEVVLFAVAMWFVFHELQTAIDSSLYRVHAPQADSTPVLLKALIITVPWIIFINLLLLIGIDRLWGKYLEKIIEPLRLIINFLKTLDLRTHRDVGADHIVLEQARYWMQQERERCKKIRHLMQSLPTQIKTLTAEEKKSLSDTLKLIKRNLP